MVLTFYPDTRHNAAMLTSEQVRFFSHVHLTAGCWLWQAALNEKGYGVFGKGGRTYKAHRLSYEYLSGPIPHGMCVLHRCDTPACVNPDHMFLGTRADNNADMHAKGRQKKGPSRKDRCLYERGEAHHEAIMTEAMVTQLRRLRCEGHSYSQLARKFCIGLTTAYKIATRKTWKHVP